MTGRSARFLSAREMIPFQFQGRLLSSQSIQSLQKRTQELVEEGRLSRPFIDPFVPRSVHDATGTSYGLSSAGYDIRLGSDIILFPGRTVLAVSLEHFVIPVDMVARVHDKSTWKRRGVELGNTVAEPGWFGHLTLEPVWHPLVGDDRSALFIEAGTPFAQMVFEPLDWPTDQPYSGKYQDQPAEPVEARWEGGR